MIRSDEQMEDSDIRSAISAVAAYSALRFKRQLVQRMSRDIAPEIATARLQGASIDTTELFLRLAENYANQD